jgi:mRNA interferase RelE/StbE
MVARIIQAVDNLAPFPPGSVKLTGSDTAWRIRIADYRVIYQVLNDRLVIEVVKVGHRRDIYR